jgi:hypothetical protein
MAEFVADDRDPAKRRRILWEYDDVETVERQPHAG